MATHPPQITRAPERRRQPVVPNAVLGVVVFIITEAMLFGGFISAYVIAETGAAPGTWPPPDQARLPVEATAFNSVVLLTSAVLLAIANRRFRSDAAAATRWMLGALALGTFFLLFQGWEWIALLSQGMTLQSSNHSSFFYLIVGAHGLHVLGAISALAGICARGRKGTLTEEVLKATSIFWYFVVGLWPILYWQVYL